VDEYSSSDETKMLWEAKQMMNETGFGEVNLNNQKYSRLSFQEVYKIFTTFFEFFFGVFR
jgi:hypothetical protein